jgi:GT2 family glycosyltransferase
MVNNIIEGVVSVVIINFNGGEYIFDCLKRVKDQTYKKIDLLIVDNCSDDGSSEILRNMSIAEGFLYYYSPRNLGASKANNYGISRSQGEYVMTLNADAFLENNYIDICVKALERNEEIGTVTGKLLSMNNINIIDSAGITLFKEGVAMERGIGEKDCGQYDKEEYIAGVCCAAAIYRRKMLSSIKYNNEYFDEDFFAFCEDTDLSISSLLQGWKSLYCPNAVAYHLRGGSTKSSSDFARYLSYRNSRYFYVKTYKHFNLEAITLHHILNIIRLFTIEKEFRRKAYEDRKMTHARLKEKRQFFSGKRNYEYLNEYVEKSYIVQNMRKRINSRFSKILEYFGFRM